VRLAQNARVERILARIRAIPRGLVQTYGDIDPAAPRLVGHVLATTDQNVPWHRVVRSDGTMAVGRGDRVDMRRAHWPTLTP